MKKLSSFPFLKWTFIGIISLIWFQIFWTASNNGNFHWGIIVHETGELGWKLLIFTIMISLIQKILNLHFPKFNFFRRLLPLRKFSGIFAFLIIGSHAFAELAKQGIKFFNLSDILAATFTTRHATIFGTISFLIMLPLFLTSTNWAIEKMGAKSWKRLQKLTHLAFIFAALHVALLEYFGHGEIEGGPIVLLAIYFSGYSYLFTRKHFAKQKS